MATIPKKSGKVTIKKSIRDVNKVETKQETKQEIKQEAKVETKQETKLENKLENNDESDIEVELEEESQEEIDEMTQLDKRLLESREELLDNEEEPHAAMPKKITIKRKVVGNARLRAVMAKPTYDPSESNDSNEDQDDQEENEDSDEKSKNRKPNTKGKKTIIKPTTKRGPGRPRKTQKKEPMPRKGISRNPQSPDSFVEFIYDQPMIMKKIFSFFKALAAPEIQILFRPRDVVFYAIDHHEKTKIRVKIDSTKLNHYYCRGNLDIGISQKEMEMILNKVDRDYSTMVILSELETSKRSLTIVFDNDIQIDELHRMDLIASYNKMENEEDFIDEEYSIKFKFPGRYFKKMISDIKSISSQLSITQEDNESPLVFEYIAENSKLQSKHTVKDSSKINLESNLADGDSFRVDVCIDYIKPISASQIADEIYIYVDENKLFMTKAYIDNGTIEIKTLTEIIDERPNDEED